MTSIKQQNLGHSPKMIDRCQRKYSTEFLSEDDRSELAFAAYFSEGLKICFCKIHIIDRI